MRINGLLSFVVVAMALGLATVASADVAIVSAIADPAGPFTWEARIRLVGDGGIGTAPTGMGFADFVFDAITGTGGAVVTDSTNVSPQGEWTDPNGQVFAGFVDFRKDGETGVGVSGTQPSNYPTANDPRLDQAVSGSPSIR